MAATDARAATQKVVPGLHLQLRRFCDPKVNAREQLRRQRSRAALSFQCKGARNHHLVPQGTLPLRAILPASVAHPIDAANIATLSLNRYSCSLGKPQLGFAGRDRVAFRCRGLDTQGDTLTTALLPLASSPGPLPQRSADLAVRNGQLHVN